MATWSFSSLAAIPQYIRPLIGELEIGASYHRQLESMLNNTSSFDEVKRNVTSEIEYFLDRLLGFVGILSSYFSIITLVIVVITSWLYHFRFQHSLVFDNIYINKDIKAYDSSQQNSLFPLEGPAEQKKLIDCLSLALSPCEKKSLLTSLLVYGVVTFFTTILIVADWILYQVTDIIRRNGHTALQVGVESEHRFSVHGGGFISTFFRFLFKEFNYQSSVFNHIDTIPCLPKPLQLSPRHLIHPAVVVVALGLVTLLQPYCLRSRHAIAAHFYPERQNERVAYLYKEMLRRRQARNASQQYRIPGRLDENKKLAEVLDHGRKLAKVLSLLGRLRRCCLLCGCPGSTIRVLGSSSSKKFQTCNRNPECSAFYCGSCWSQLDNCAICQLPNSQAGVQ